MRFEIYFQSECEIRMPIHYNSAVQGMIYDNLSPEFARELHDTGYAYEKRRFRLFTFSSLSGRYRLDRSSGEIIFSPPVKLLVSSPIERFIYELGYSMLMSGDLKLGDNKVKIANLSVPAEVEIKTPQPIGMLSPITVYSTLSAPDGRTKTYYYSPFEEEFSQLIENNLKKKYFLIHHQEPNENQTISIKPLKVGRRSEKILKYKDTIIRAWRGVYVLEGDPELMKVGYDSGLGSKNSQGFGCFKLLERGENDDRSY